MFWVGCNCLTEALEIAPGVAISLARFYTTSTVLRIVLRKSRLNQNDVPTRRWKIAPNLEFYWLFRCSGSPPATLRHSTNRYDVTQQRLRSSHGSFRSAAIYCNETRFTPQPVAILSLVQAFARLKSCALSVQSQGRSHRARGAARDPTKFPLAMRSLPFADHVVARKGGHELCWRRSLRTMVLRAGAQSGFTLTA